jgi:hypothetical protein
VSLVCTNPPRIIFSGTGFIQEVVTRLLVIVDNGFELCEAESTERLVAELDTQLEDINGDA